MRRMSVVAGLVVLAMLGGSATSAVGQTAPATEPQLLHPDGASYPRVIRLEHSGAANGRVLASVGTVDGSALGVILESTDGGATFQQVGSIADPEGADGRGMCCGTLFELPSPVGDMPAGTLLWAGTFGYKVPEADRHTKQRLWISRDLGRTWTFRSDIATSPEPVQRLGARLLRGRGRAARRALLRRVGQTRTTTRSSSGCVPPTASPGPTTGRPSRTPTSSSARAWPGAPHWPTARTSSSTRCATWPSRCAASTSAPPPTAGTTATRRPGHERPHR